MVDGDRIISMGVVVDDCMLVAGMAAWVRAEPDLRLFLGALTVDHLLHADGVEALNVVVLDLQLRDGSDAVDNVKRLVGAGHRVLVVSAWCQPTLVAATFAAGARGYLTKEEDLHALAAAIREIAAGGVAYSPGLGVALMRDPQNKRPALSNRERAVLVAYTSGMTLNAVARHIGISPETAKTYLQRVKRKYQEIGRPASTKGDMARRAREDMIVTPSRADDSRERGRFHDRGSG